MLGRERRKTDDRRRMTDDGRYVFARPVLGRPVGRPSSVARRPSICKLSANAIDSIEILTIHSGTSRFGSLGHAVPKCDGQIVLALSVVHSIESPGGYL